MNGYETAPSDRKMPEYYVWRSMIQRCFNRNNRAYHSYGGRGIGVGRRWRSFEKFIADVGARPSRSHSLGRIDNGKGYKPGNVEWQTRLEQTNNTRRNRLITLHGATKTVAEWARLNGIAYGTFLQRVRRDLPLDKLFLRLLRSRTNTKKDAKEAIPSANKIHPKRHAVDDAEAVNGLTKSCRGVENIWIPSTRSRSALIGRNDGVCVKDGYEGPGPHD